MGKRLRVCKVKFDNLPLKDSAEYIALRYGPPLSGEAVFRQWTTEIRHMYQKEIPLKQGAAKYLYYLKSSGKKTALVTVNNKELAVGCMGNNHVLEFAFIGYYAGKILSGGFRRKQK